MPAYKCIGGILDGQRRFLDDGHKELLVRIGPRLSARDFLVRDFLPPRKPLTIETREEVYVLDRVRSDHGDVTYLRPRSWSSLQALRHALT